MRDARLILVVVAFTLLTGCWFKRKPPAKAPPPAPAAVKRAPAVRKPASPPRRTVAKPRRAKPSPPAAKQAPPPALPEVEPEMPVSTPSAQQLGSILSPEDRSRFRSMYEQSWVSAREMLASLAGRALTPEQADAAGRIRSFLKQAQETGSSDWSAAAQRARRAELLARDLLRALQ